MNFFTGNRVDFFALEPVMSSADDGSESGEGCSFIISLFRPILCFEPEYSEAVLQFPDVVARRF